VPVAAAAFAATALGLVAVEPWLDGAAAAVAVGAAVIVLLGGFAVHALRHDAARLRASEQWQRRLRGELRSQSAFLDRLVASLGAIAGSLEIDRVLERTAEQAQALLDAPVSVVLVADPTGRTLRPAAARGVALGPMAGLTVTADAAGSLIAEAARSGTPTSGAVAEDGDPVVAHLRPAALLAAPLQALGETYAVLVLARLADGETFAPDDVTRAALFADFAARAAENALLFERVQALLAQAQQREVERGELSRRVVSAEQDERRKLSLYLHDGPLQSLSGVAMMLDAAYEDIGTGAVGDAQTVLETARERQRGVVRSLRELCFALEPWVLRDQGFVSAVSALAGEFERGHRVRIELDVDDADRLPPDDQVCLYQIVREAVTNAVKHARPEHIDVVVTGAPEQGFRAVVRDDGAGFTSGPDDGLPHHGMASMRERAALLSGDLRVESVPGAGTTVSVTLPARVADVA
jgi:signal transduction histidine kinase